MTLFGRVICVRRLSASYVKPKLPVVNAVGGASMVSRFGVSYVYAVEPVSGSVKRAVRGDAAS
jgi:hypothetical protein